LQLKTVERINAIDPTFGSWRYAPRLRQLLAAFTGGTIIPNWKPGSRRFPEFNPLHSRAANLLAFSGTAAQRSSAKPLRALADDGFARNPQWIAWCCH
jgi:hypothetical protein